MRAIGYYWVQAEEDGLTADWQIGFWNGEAWELLGTDEAFDELTMQAVTETLIMPPAED